MLDSGTYVTEQRERAITIHGAGTLAARLLLVLVQASSCAPLKISEPPRAETPPSREVQQPPPAPPVEQSQPTPTDPPPTATEQPKPAHPPQPKAAEPSQPKPAGPPRPKPPEPPRPRESAAAPPSGQERAAIHDLTSLEKRLRDTSAIGVFTKLSLKNQVDDLLDKFRAYHRGQPPPLAELREHYDLLLIKILTVLQDGDPTLASAIASSKSAIWDILADRDKFQKI